MDTFLLKILHNGMKDFEKKGRLYSPLSASLFYRCQRSIRLCDQRSSVTVGRGVQCVKGICCLRFIQCAVLCSLDRTCNGLCGIQLALEVVCHVAQCLLDAEQGVKIFADIVVILRSGYADTEAVQPCGVVEQQAAVALGLFLAFGILRL